MRQNASGIYSFLPFGLKVLHKVERIVREEMERAGAVELLMPAMQAQNYGKNQVVGILTDRINAYERS